MEKGGGGENISTTTTSANKGKQQILPEGRRQSEPGRWALSLVLKGLGPASVLGLGGSRY